MVSVFPIKMTSEFLKNFTSETLVQTYLNDKFKEKDHSKELENLSNGIKFLENEIKKYISENQTQIINQFKNIPKSEEKMIKSKPSMEYLQKTIEG